jgi:hypothetical protein
MEDTEFDDGVMDGKRVKSGKFAGSMRRFLMAEHLGLLDNPGGYRLIVEDPICQKFYSDVWLKTAALNTKVVLLAFFVLKLCKLLPKLQRSTTTR